MFEEIREAPKNATELTLDACNTYSADMLVKFFAGKD